MTTWLRASSGPLALALQGNVQLWAAKLLTVTLVDRVTVYRWAQWDKDLGYGGEKFTASRPWLEIGGWNVSNKMEVPSLKVKIGALNNSFNGGANLKTQIAEGLFDGATVLYNKAFMDSPDNTNTLGGTEVFGGFTSSIDVTGLLAEITCKGKINSLNQNTPRNIFQISCNHAFCDPGCTLARASFTNSYSVGSSPAATPNFVPWSSAPANPSRYVNGTFALTSGTGAGARRNVQAADSSGLTFEYPLANVPVPGDTFTAFEGCNKAFDDGVNIQDCTARANTQHHRGFEFVPPPNSAY